MDVRHERQVQPASRGSRYSSTGVWGSCWGSGGWTESQVMKFKGRQDNALLQMKEEEDDGGGLDIPLERVMAR